MTIDIKYVGKITASKEVFNALALIARHASEYSKSMGYEGQAKSEDNMFEQIYDELNASGYYSK